MQKISDRFPDRNEHDEYYLTEHGWVAKVRVEDATTETHIVFQISGSWAEEGSDRARRTESGQPFVLPPERHTVQHDNVEEPVDLVAFLEEKRLAMARRIDLAASNHYARVNLQGVKSRPEPLAALAPPSTA